jgi:hypothetical protein
MKKRYLGRCKLGHCAEASRYGFKPNVIEAASFDTAHNLILEHGHALNCVPTT